MKYQKLPKWELKNIYKALNKLNLLNTEEENKKLKEVKKELKRRK